MRFRRLIVLLSTAVVLVAGGSILTAGSATAWHIASIKGHCDHGNHDQQGIFLHVGLKLSDAGPGTWHDSSGNSGTFGNVKNIEYDTPTFAFPLTVYVSWTDHEQNVPIVLESGKNCDNGGTTTTTEQKPTTTTTEHHECGDVVADVAIQCPTTTTTEHHDTTTSLPTSSTTAPSSTTTGPSGSSTTTPGAVVTGSGGGGSLAFTGADAFPLTVLGGALAAGGTALARRRKRIH